jgi:hypothetical protein
VVRIKDYVHVEYLLRDAQMEAEQQVPEVFGAHAATCKVKGPTLVVVWCAVANEGAGRTEEQLISDWALAPVGVRTRALHLAKMTLPSQSVAILKMEPRGLITGGAWAVALVPAGGGRRVLMYAEDVAGNVLADWSTERGSA